MKDFDFNPEPARAALTGGAWVPRDITALRIWKRKPFDAGRALVDLYFLANTEAGTHAFNSGVKVDYQPGDLLWSITGLAERWGWGRDTVREFLSQLERAEIVKIVGEHQHGKIIRILGREVTGQVTGYATREVTGQVTEGDRRMEIGDKENGEGDAPPAALGGGKNFPRLMVALDYFASNGSDYTSEEVRAAWHALNATAQDGVWFFGRRPVGDWRSAMETKLADQGQKKIRAPHSGEKNGVPDRFSVPLPAGGGPVSFSALRTADEASA